MNSNEMGFCQATKVSLHLIILESVILNNARAPPLNPQIPSVNILHIVCMNKVQVLD